MSMFTRSIRTPVVASLSAMAIFGLSQMAWADEVYEMDVNNWTSASHHYTKNVWDPWTKMVEEKTDGRVKVHVHQGSALGKSTTVYQDVRGGLYDVGVVVPNYIYDTKFFPYTIGNLPFALNGPDGAMTVLQEFVEKYAIPNLEDELVVFQTMATDSYDIFSRDPIRSVDDFKGKKVRINGKSERPFVEALGAVPVSIPVEEIYEAFDKGMMDVAYYTPIGGYSFKFNEPAPYFSVLAVAATPLTPVMSLDFYESLPEDLQQLFDDELGPALTAMFRDSYTDLLEESHDGLRQDAEEKGEFIELDEETISEIRQLSKGSWDAWIEDANAKGYDGEQMVEDYFALLEKHGYEKPF